MGRYDIYYFACGRMSVCLALVLFVFCHCFAHLSLVSRLTLTCQVACHGSPYTSACQREYANALRHRQCLRFALDASDFGALASTASAIADNGTSAMACPCCAIQAGMADPSGKEAWLASPVCCLFHVFAMWWSESGERHFPYTARSYVNLCMRDRTLIALSPSRVK